MRHMERKLDILLRALIQLATCNFWYLDRRLTEAEHGSGAMMIRYCTNRNPPGKIMSDDMQLGRLNLLTPTRVAAAAKLITDGDIVSLKYASLLPINPKLISSLQPSP